MVLIIIINKENILEALERHKRNIEEKSGGRLVRMDDLEHFRNIWEDQS